MNKILLITLIYCVLSNSLSWGQKLSYEELLKQADEKAAKRDYTGALVDYDLLIRKNPTETELRYKRGIALYRTYDYNKAIIDLSKATLDEQYAENAYLYRGQVRIDAKQYISALEDFGKVVKRNPQNIEVYRHRGYCKLLMNKAQKGLLDLEVYLEFSPKKWEDYHNLTKDILRSETSDTRLLQKAEEWINLSLKLDKNSSNQKTQENLLKKLNKNINNSQTKIEPPIINKPVVNEVPDLNISDFGSKTNQIWAVVVGVSKYKNSGLNLNYADRDAQDYAKFLQSPNGGNLDSEHITLLTNEKATRSNIIKALREKFGRAFEDDMVIFYMASHGQPDPVGEEVYFLNTDTDTDNLVGTALAQSDIEKIFQQTRAKRKLWLADACHSGGVGTSKGIRGPANLMTNKLLEELATTNSGMVLLTASSASEFSYEDTKWGGGHGVFTYHLLEGLKGKANLNNNSFITIREIQRYVFDQVSKDTNGQQHPELKGRFDNDFPMSVVK